VQGLRKDDNLSPCDDAAVLLWTCKSVTVNRGFLGCMGYKFRVAVQLRRNHCHQSALLLFWFDPALTLGCPVLFGMTTEAGIIG
jgi:hypothetical protein